MWVPVRPIARCRRDCSWRARLRDALLLLMLAAGLVCPLATPCAVRSLGLANGLRIRLVPDGNAQGLEAWLVLRAGEIDERADEVGLAHLTALRLRDRAFAGPEAPPLEVRVTPDTTIFHVRVDDSPARDAIRWLAVAARPPERPTAKVDLAPLRRELLDTWSREAASAPVAAERELLQRLFPGHPYGRPRPDETTLSRYDMEHVQDFQQTRYGARRAQLILMGSFEPESAERMIRESFAAWSTGPAPLELPPAETATTGLHWLDRPGAPQSTLRIGIRVVGPSHPDFGALALANALLGDSPSSRLAVNLRRRGLAYSPSSEIRVLRGATYWVLRVDVATEATGAALREIYDELHRSRAAGPRPDELARTHDSMRALHELYHPQGLLSTAVDAWLLGLDGEELLRMRRALGTLSPSEVQSAVLRYLDPARMTLVVAGDRSRVSPQLGNDSPSVGRTRIEP